MSTPSPSLAERRAARPAPRIWLTKVSAIAIPPVREFFEMSMLTAGQWFLALVAAALGLVAASLMWRLPVIQSWEADEDDYENQPPMERNLKPEPGP